MAAKKGVNGNGNSSKFMVDLGTLQLADVDRRAIAAAIQGAVLSYLGSHQLVPKQTYSLLDDGGGLAGMIPDLGLRGPKK